MADFGNIQIGQRVKLSEEDLAEFTPLDDVQVGQRVQLSDDDMNQFQPMETVSDTQSYFAEDSGKTYDAPPGMRQDEVEYLDNVQNEERDRGGFFGFVDVGVDSAANLAKGYLGGLVEGSVALGTAGLGSAEKTLQELQAEKAAPTQVRPLDYLAQFLPTARGEVAEIKISEKFGGDKTFQSEIAALQERIAGMRQSQEAVGGIVEGMGLEKSGDNVVSNVVYDVGKGGQSLVQSIGAAAITRNPSLATAIFAMQQKSGDYREARDKGLSVDKANEMSNLTAGVNAAIEYVGTGTFLKILETSKPLKRAFRGFVENAIEEGAQELTSVLIKNDYGVTDSNFQEGLQQVAYSAFIGGLVGAPVSVILGNNPEEFEKQTGVSAKDAQKVVKQIEKALDNDPSIGDTVTTELKQILRDEMSPLADDAQGREAVIKVFTDFASGQEINTENLDPELQGMVAKLNDIQMPANVAERNNDDGLIVAYHGTNQKIDKFKTDGLGTHFGNEKQANDRIKQRKIVDKLDDVNAKEQVIQVKLDIKNPIRLPDFETWKPDDIAKHIFVEYGIKIEGNATNEKIKEALKSNGYDGIVYKNMAEMEGMAELVAEFESLPKDVSPEIWKPMLSKIEEFRAENAEDSYIAFDENQIKTSKEKIDELPEEAMARNAEENASFDQEYLEFFEDNERVPDLPEVGDVIERMRANFDKGSLVEVKGLDGELLKFAENLNSKTEAKAKEIRMLEGKEFIPVPRGATPTLAQFLKDNGGLAPDTDLTGVTKNGTFDAKLAARQAKNLKGGAKRGFSEEIGQFTKKNNPAMFGVANKNGTLTLDQARELAVEAGYLSEEGGDGASQSTVNDLLEALMEEADGNPRYRDSDMELVAAKQDAQAFNEDMDIYIQTQLADAKDYVSFSSAFKDGARLARSDVKAAQGAIIDLIESAKLRPADKAKFIRSLKNIDSINKAKRQLPKIRKRVETLLKADSVRKLRAEISKSLKKAKAKKQGGRLKGKYTPEIQKQLDQLYRIDKLTKQEANDELAKSFTLDEIPSPEQRTINTMLMAKAEASEASVESLVDLAVRVKTLIQGGRNVNLYLESVREAQLKEDAKGFVDLIGEVPVRENYNWRTDLAAWMKEKGNNLFNNWAGTLETKLLYAFDSKDNKAVNDFIDQKASLFEESRAFDKGKQDTILEIEERILEASGMSRKELQKRMYKDTSEMIDLGNMVHSDGRTRRVKMTRAEARKRYMEFQDEELRLTLFDDKTGNRYTPEIESAIEAALSGQDLAIVDAQMEFYNEYYDRVNETYRKVYAVDLPKVEFYSPIRRANFDVETSQFLQGVAAQGSVAPGSTKGRVSSRSEILAAGDLEVLMSHVYEMEYFIAYAEKVNDMRRLFGKSEVQRALKDKMGGEFARSINKDIDYFSGKGAQGSFLGEKTLKVLVRNFGFAQLAAKPQIGLKQLTSFPAMVSGVKTKDFAVGLAEFAKNPKAALEILNDSEFFQKRGYAIDKDFKAMTEDKHFLNLMGKKPGILKFLMLPIKYGDKGAIAFGGYGHYHAQRKAGMSHEKALDSFSRLANKTQQSSDIDQFSQLQQKNDVISQVLTQFMSSPNALARAEYRAIINGLKGRISKKEFAKQFFVYHFLIPNLFTLAANGFEFEPEDHLKTSILGTASGIFLFGDILESVVSEVISGDHFEATIRHPVEFIDGVMKFVEDLADGDIEISDFWEGGKELNSGLKAVGAGTGVPLATLHNQLVGINDAMNGDVVEGGYKALGYSPWVIDNKILD